MRKILVCFLFVCVLSVAAQSAFALPLFNDPAAINSVSGDYIFGGAGNQPLFSLHVESAVYLTGGYSANGGYDPSGGADTYLYAYTFSNNVESDVGADDFSVGILPGVLASNAFSDAAYGGIGGVSPFLSMLVGTPLQNAKYLFLLDTIDPGEHSSVLLFTSDMAPTDGYATVSAGGAGGMVSVITPMNVPEPAGLLLIGAGAVFMRKRKNKSLAKSCLTSN